MNYMYQVVSVEKFNGELGMTFVGKPYTRLYDAQKLVEKWMYSWRYRTGPVPFELSILKVSLNVHEVVS